jgi:hypothetical protein
MLISIFWICFPNNGQNETPKTKEERKWGNREMGKWGNGEMGKWGNGEIKNKKSKIKNKK